MALNKLAPVINPPCPPAVTMLPATTLPVNDPVVANNPFVAFKLPVRAMLPVRLDIEPRIPDVFAEIRPLAAIVMLSPANVGNNANVLEYTRVFV